MKKILWSLAAIALLGAIAAHWYYADRGRFTTEPTYNNLQRTVVGNTLSSSADPAIRIRFDESLQYLGGQQFILYGVADTEQYFFARIDDSDRLTALYWLQFEAYRPDNNYRYDYDDSPGRLQMGGFEFYVDTAPVRTDPSRRRRGTDGALMRRFLAERGYTLPQEFFYARAVHLTDASRRKELMVIFVDDLAPTGESAPDLAPDGPAADRWPAIERAFLDTFEAGMTLERPAN